MVLSQRVPAMQIDAAGSRLPERCARAFSGLRVHQNLSQPTVCELDFVGLKDGEVESAMPLGATLRVAQQGVAAKLFEGRVTAIEYSYDAGRPPTVAVRAYDPLFTLRNRQSLRSHVGVSALEVARELVADLGLDIEATAPGPVWPYLLQTGSDFDLLADVAARCGLYLFVQDGVLALLTLEGTGAPQALKLNDNLLDARFEVNGNGACRSVTANGWDPWRGVAHAGTAAAARVGRAVDAEAPASAIGGKDQRSLLAATFQGDAHAEAWAQAELDRRGADEVVFRGTALGNPRLRPGARVEIAGVAARVAGQYVIASAKHTLDVDRGFQSELSSALPLLAPRRSGAALTLGQVTRIDDPDRLGRIQVTLPAYGDLATEWLQFVAAGAGAGKGLVAPPDVGDLVLLLIEQGDAAQAVVLGSLYGERGLPEGHDVLGKDAAFCFLTPGGQRLRLDDAKNTVRIENKDGSVLEMAPGAVKLHAAAPLTIEAPGQKMVIRAKFIDFDRV
ncbi:MAG: phage baseplate assembly protein V [Rhizobacter sp.]